MITSVHNYPISQLFDIEAGVVYAVPMYQREYTWGASQWEQLFDDLQENSTGYFLGSMICINQSRDALEVQQLEVVDGQQRLTTLSLLLAALHQHLKQREANLTDEQRAEVWNLRCKLILKKKDGQLRVIPQVQNNNQADYRAVLAEAKATSHQAAPPYAGNRRIVRAYRYFCERIRLMSERDDASCSSVMAFLDKVSQASLVKIEVASHADAYTLFESLNNRGMPLTAIDLIKNKLLAELHSKEPDQVGRYFEIWTQLLGKLGDDYAVQERFFRHYYNAFRDELNKPYRKDDDKSKYPVAPLARRSNLMEIYERLIRSDAKGQLDALWAAADLYAVLLSNSADPRWSGLERPVLQLERVQATPSHLLMLYLLKRSELMGIETNHLKDIAGLVVAFFVRRNLTDSPPTRDLTALFMELVDKVAALRGDAVVAAVREELAARAADDATFRARLEGQIYDENSGVARFVLCALAERDMTRETEVDLWRVDGKQYVWTIEHIFPQGENIPSAWVTMIADGDATKARDVQQRHVHRLGNLTITGYNSELGNKSFEEKRDRKDRQGRFVGYRNKLGLNVELAAASAWTVPQIEARTTTLVDSLVTMFSLGAPASGG